MTVRKLNGNDVGAVMELFCQCFKNDHYYAQLFTDEATREADMKKAFRGSIEYCLCFGECLGVYTDDALSAFLLTFDYNRSKVVDRSVFLDIFGGDGKHMHSLPYYEDIHKRLRQNDDILFLLSVAVSDELRGQGIASMLLDKLMAEHSEYSFAGDVSNDSSLGMYSKRGFDVISIDEGYHLVYKNRDSSAKEIDFYEEYVQLVLPCAAILDSFHIDYKLLNKKACIADAVVVDSQGYRFFEDREGSIAYGDVVQVSYDGLLEYQRVINLSQVTEHVLADKVYYTLDVLHCEKPLFNPVLEEMIASRKREWSLIPDVYVSVPVEYSDIERLRRGDGSFILDVLDFRTNYEAGIPTSMKNVDELANLKMRLKRFRLGRYRIRVMSEISLENYKGECDVIGSAAYVEMYATVDMESSCAVLTWYSMSCPFLISQYTDNVISNKLMIDDCGQWRNVFDFLNSSFGVIKRGTPKIFITVPRERSCLSESQLASVLAGETIYPDGEQFGAIVDREIMDIVTSQTGMGQYDRGVVCAYTNVVIQFSPDLKASVRDRIIEESITLYYMELILLEEAAIHLADHSIIKLFNSEYLYSPVDFLCQVDYINDTYSRTIEFWNIQVNYPTSQKSMDMLRGAFCIDRQLDNMYRNRAQLQTVFDTKCEMIDRTETKRMNTSLAILSLLAIISAWTDSYSFIETVGAGLSENAVSLIQKIALGLILAVGIYTVAHMFGTRSIINAKRRKRKKERRNNK